MAERGDRRRNRKAPARTQRQANQSRAASRKAQQDAGRQDAAQQRQFTAIRGGRQDSERARNLHNAEQGARLRAQQRAARRQAQQAAPARQPRRGAQAGPGRQSRQVQQGQIRQRTQTVQGRQASQQPDSGEYTSTSVGELRRADRAKRLQKSSRRYAVRIVAVVVLVVVLILGSVGVYHSNLFAIENVSVNGVEHLTASEMTQLVNVPSDTTLLRVDTDTIADRLRHSAWVDEVQVNRVFPDTLELNVTERQIAAIVEIPTNTKALVKNWAIATDHVWLMPIPEPGSEGASTTSAKIYEDAENVLHIKDLPFGTKADIGDVCSDANVNNALDIVGGMTTSLADRIVEISAPGIAETTLILDNGVEIAFGKAEDIRDKERVILEILEQNADNVAYINVRMVETPTWRAI